MSSMPRNQRRDFGRILLVLGILAISLYGCWQWKYPSTTWRYRLTIAVEADGQVHEGSGVVEVTFSRVPAPLPEMRSVDTEIRGQAVFVDLGARGNLAAIIPGYRSTERPKSDSLSHLSQNVFRERNPDFNIYDMRSMTGVVEISPELLPALVYFKNVNDPASHVIVDPGDMAAAYGAGVEIRSVSIEVTRDPVTTGIEDKLPLLKSLARGDALLAPGMSPAYPLYPQYFYRNTYKDVRS